MVLISPKFILGVGWQIIGRVGCAHHLFGLRFLWLVVFLGCAGRKRNHVLRSRAFFTLHDIKADRVALLKRLVTLAAYA